MKSNCDCLIVAGGYTDIPFLRDYLKQFTFRYIIAADRGIEALRLLSKSPTHLVGDFDSADREQVSELIKDESLTVERLIPEKDDTDSEHAMDVAVKLGCDRIILAAASGTRLDHTLANVNILYKAIRKGIEAWMIDSHNRVRLIQGTTVLKKSEGFGKYVSLFPFSGVVRGISLRGFKYPLTDAVLEPVSCFGLCVSNELVEETGVIEVEEGVLILIESRD